MGLQVNVQGGTRAGLRRVREQVKTDWRCPSCKATVRYYWASCPNCSHPRV